MSNKVKKYEGYRPNEMAREIILNALNEIIEVDNNFITTELEEISNQYNSKTTKAVRNYLLRFAQKTFNKFHSSKFDMSGHPIVEKFE